MVLPTLTPVTGVRMDPEFFRIDELHEFDPDRVIDVLREDSWASSSAVPFRPPYARK